MNASLRRPHCVAKRAYSTSSTGFWGFQPTWSPTWGYTKDFLLKGTQAYLSTDVSPYFTISAKLEQSLDPSEHLAILVRSDMCAYRFGYKFRSKQKKPSLDAVGVEQSSVSRHISYLGAGAGKLTLLWTSCMASLLVLVLLAFGGSRRIIYPQWYLATFPAGYLLRVGHNDRYVEEHPVRI